MFALAVVLTCTFILYTSATTTATTSTPLNSVK